MEMKMRVMIDSEGDIYIAIIATIIHKYTPFAFLEGDTISAVSKKFQDILVNSLEMPIKHEY